MKAAALVPLASGAALLVSTALAATACSHVAPYERERLAHRTMVEMQYVGPAEAHVQAVQEGAAGGGLEAVSGCGCN
jgi:hypothetical protein